MNLEKQVFSCTRHGRRIYIEGPDTQIDVDIYIGEAWLFPEFALCDMGILLRDVDTGAVYAIGALARDPPPPEGGRPPQKRPETALGRAFKRVLGYLPARRARSF